MVMVDRLQQTWQSIETVNALPIPSMETACLIPAYNRQ